MICNGWGSNLLEPSRHDEKTDTNECVGRGFLGRGREVVVMYLEALIDKSL